MGNYVTATEVRAEGVPTGISDVRINARIVKWEEIVEMITGQVFREITPGELTFDGNNSHILHFNLPLITINSVKVNSGDTALETTEFTAFTGRQKPQDDRRNPKIKLKNVRESVYQSLRVSKFLKGYDQKVDATWGFLDENGNAPAGLKAAVIELVLFDLFDYFDQQSNASILSAMKREKTDDHEIEYQPVEDAKALWSFIPKDIQDMLALYRRPWKISAPQRIIYPEGTWIETVSVGAW
jgi:hypothetical protein